MKTLLLGLLLFCSVLAPGVADARHACTTDLPCCHGRDCGPEIDRYLDNLCAETGCPPLP